MVLIRQDKELNRWVRLGEHSLHTDCSVNLTVRELQHHTLGSRDGLDDWQEIVFLH
jgi:hypothetical protein